MPVLDAQGHLKGAQQIYRGMIILFYGARIPEGWALCDGTLGTPDLTDRVLVGDTAIGTGTAGGTVSAAAVTHTGFALGNHSVHTPTQSAAHSAHTPTQADAHDNHVATQPDAHGIHASQGDHNHNVHTIAATGSVAVAGTKLTGPTVHSTVGAHTHGVYAHAHADWGADAHSAHAGFAVDAHSAHTGFAVDGHSAHSVTQPDTHTYKLMTLAYVMKV